MESWVHLVELFHPTGAPVLDWGVLPPRTLGFPLIIPAWSIGKGLSQTRRKIALQPAKRTESSQQGKGEDFKASKLPPSLPRYCWYRARLLLLDLHRAVWLVATGAVLLGNLLKSPLSPHYVRAMRPPATPLQWRRICSS